MGKRKNPDTSNDAYHNLDPIRVSKTMTKITEALKVIGKGNFEDIALAAGMAEQKVWKRLIDCVRAGLIHRLDEKKKTKQNNNSYLYAPGPATQLRQKRERVMKGKTVADHSRDIQEIQKTIFKQPTLF
jgi:hypothetical protein